MIGNGSANINLKLFNVPNVWQNAETRLIPEDWQTIGTGGNKWSESDYLIHEKIIFHMLYGAFHDQGSAQLVITDYPKNISVKVRKCPFCLTRN